MMKRVALFYNQRLLGESVERLLANVEGFELLGPWIMDQTALDHLETAAPDVVVIVDEQNQINQVAHLTNQILEKFQNLSVIQVTLQNTLARVVHTHTVPARGYDLIKAIRNLCDDLPEK